MSDRLGSGTSGKGLLEQKNYCAITFPNTHSALQAEKLLKESGTYAFVVMPVPRLVSAGCGLAVKVFNEDSADVLGLLAGAGVNVDGAYNINSEAGTARLVS